MLAAAPFHFLETLDRVDDAIDTNAKIASEILHYGLLSFGLDAEPTDPALDWRGAATPADVDKARSSIRQFCRDWSAENAEERRSCYEPVISDICRRFVDCEDKSQIKILVPGAGLGRLLFDLCCQGFTMEGNEISYHQLLASNWILNQTKSAEQFALYPFAFDFSNVISRQYQLKRVTIPDVHPGTELDNASQNTSSHAFDRLSMTAADFVVLYRDEKHEGIFDAVATVFFVDTAPNVITYIQVIHHCLKSGGIWVNLGPLLWHFADRVPSSSTSSSNKEEKKPESQSQNNGIGEPGNVELSLEELFMLIEKIGFEVEEREFQNTNYIHDPQSMLQNKYRSIRWVARKI